jgi:hypothetical protein
LLELKNLKFMARPKLLVGSLCAGLWLSCAVSATAQESLGVSLTPASVSFALSAGSATNAGSVPVAVTVNWVLLSTRNTISVYGYFTNAAAGLAHTSPANPVDIPSSRIEVSVNGGGLAAFNQTVPFGAAGAGRRLAQQAITILNLLGQRTDTLQLNINLSGYVLPADTYTGSLRIRVQATP